MSKETNLDAEIRAESGKSAVKKVLAAGKIPSVIYGLGEDSLNIALDKISEVERNTLVVNGDRISVGANYRTKFKEVIGSQRLG